MNQRCHLVVTADYYQNECSMNVKSRLFTSISSESSLIVIVSPQWTYLASFIILLFWVLFIDHLLLQLFFLHRYGDSICHNENSIFKSSVCKI